MINIYANQQHINKNDFRKAIQEVGAANRTIALQIRECITDQDFKTLLNNVEKIITRLDCAVDTKLEQFSVTMPDKEQQESNIPDIEVDLYNNQIDARLGVLDNNASQLGLTTTNKVYRNTLGRAVDWYIDSNGNDKLFWIALAASIGIGAYWEYNTDETGTKRVSSDKSEHTKKENFFWKSYRKFNGRFRAAFGWPDQLNNNGFALQDTTENPTIPLARLMTPISNISSGNTLIGAQVS